MVRALNKPRRGSTGYGDPSSQVWATPAGGAAHADDGDDTDAALAMIDAARCASLGFFPWKTEYEARFGADAPSLQLKVRPRDARATVAFLDTHGDPLSDTHHDAYILGRPLTDGEVVVVRVTAADGVTTRDYRVTVVTSTGLGSAPGSGSDVPLLVVMESPPVAHDGVSDYEIRLAFSEALHGEFSYETLRDHAFTVEGGSIKKVGRVNRDGPERNKRWKVTAKPSGSGDMVLTLNPGPACGQAHAICGVSGGAACREFPDHDSGSAAVAVDRRVGGVAEPGDTTARRRSRRGCGSARTSGTAGPMSSGR